MAEKNNSLEKALTVLDLFLGIDRITISDAAKATGYSKSALTRIFNSLENTNYIYRDRRDNGYYLTNKFYILGNNTSLKNQIVNVLNDPIEELCDKTRFSVNVGIIMGNTGINVLRKDAKSTLSLVPNIGFPLSLNCSASGKVLVAFSRDYKALIDKIKFVKLTDKTVTTKREYTKQILKVKQEGLAYDMEEITPGLVCVSAPVIGLDGYAVCSISVSGYKETMMNNMDNSIKCLRDTVLDVQTLMK